MSQKSSNSMYTYTKSVSHLFKMQYLEEAFFQRNEKYIVSNSKKRKSI